MDDLSLTSHQENDIISLELSIAQRLATYDHAAYAPTDLQSANPGRLKIVPNIARLAHITNEIVRDKPPIDEVIRMFKNFVGDHILVGHNIKSCDIPHITKAAKRAGIAFDNDYFDTYRYAKTMKDTMGWENVKLEYLSQQFGISHPDVHRAWCDAEANVGVYFRLKGCHDPDYLSSIL